MKKYLSVKLVDAEPDNQAGFKVVYKDGYTSWCPVEVFKEANLPIAKPDRITQEDVDGFIKKIRINTYMPKTTVVEVELINGFTIVEASSCVDPTNYDEKEGAEICMEKIKDKIWMLLGFLLQCGVSGFNEKEVMQ